MNNAITSGMALAEGALQQPFRTTTDTYPKSTAINTTGNSSLPNPIYTPVPTFRHGTKQQQGPCNNHKSTLPCLRQAKYSNQ